MGIYSRAPRGNFITGNMVRAEVTNHHYGYWASGARTFFVGEIPSEFSQAYRNNVHLKQAALNLIKPGVSCSQVFNEIVKEANQAGIDLWQEPGIGHGVGVGEREAPYLSSNDSTLLKPGMVITLAVYTRGPNKELICSKDTYEITEHGTRLLSWYRDWDANLYQVVGNTARHG
jgi:Xaa-Pro dipeptidase